VRWSNAHERTPLLQVEFRLQQMLTTNSALPELPWQAEYAQLRLRLETLNGLAGTNLTPPAELLFTSSDTGLIKVNKGFQQEAKKRIRDIEYANREHFIVPVTLEDECFRTWVARYCEAELQSLCHNIEVGMLHTHQGLPC
jgi:hypothetical protein